MTEFKKGDIVSFGGVECEILDPPKYTAGSSVWIDQGDGLISFTSDGRWSEKHTEPLLKLVRRKREPFRFEMQMQWIRHPNGLVYACEDGEPFVRWSNLVGRKGKLVFEESEK